MNTGIDILY